MTLQKMRWVVVALLAATACSSGATQPGPVPPPGANSIGLPAGAGTAGARPPSSAGVGATSAAGATATMPPGNVVPPPPTSGVAGMTGSAFPQAGSSAMSGVGGASGSAAAGATATAPIPDTSTAGPALAGECPTQVAFNPTNAPTGNVPGKGELVTGFQSAPSAPDGETFRNRQFVVWLPPNYSDDKVYPVLVIVTGTVESTYQSMFATSAGLGQAFLNKGWILIGAVRRSSSSPAAMPGSGTPDPGWTWWPWDEGSTSITSRWNKEVGPDGAYMKAIVKCAATKHKLDASRLFVTGVSSGGTMTHRLLTFQHDFWAGGAPQSGEWYVGTGAQDEINQVRANPSKIFLGRCCPNPLPDKGENRSKPLFVVSVWQGDRDLWCTNNSSNCTSPGPEVLSDYRPATQAASNFFSDQPDVTHVACSVMNRHMWTQVAAFSPWLADLFYAHPKGSTTAPNNSSTFKLAMPAPAPMSCVVGRYLDHYK